MTAGNTLVLVGHPHHDKSVLNAELARRWADLPNTEVRWVDSGPIDVAAEQAAVEHAAHVVLQFPLYWYGPPACLKQWMDDVLTWGWAFGPNGGLLQGRTLQCSITVGGRLSDYTLQGKHGTTLESLMEPIARMCNYVGMDWKGTAGVDRDALAAQQGVQLLAQSE